MATCLYMAMCVEDAVPVHTYPISCLCLFPTASLDPFPSPLIMVDFIYQTQSTVQWPRERNVEKQNVTQSLMLAGLVSQLSVIECAPWHHPQSVKTLSETFYLQGIGFSPRLSCVHSDTPLSLCRISWHARTHVWTPLSHYCSISIFSRQPQKYNLRLDGR